MAVNVDTVYQTVQALANKEQRGYLTPQEFNLFAIQAQNDLFEQYFYDLNALRQQRPEEHLVGDSVKTIMEKLVGTTGVTVTNAAALTNNATTLPAGRTGRIFCAIGGIRKSLRLIDEDEIHDLIGSRWHRAAFDEAVYFEDGYKRIQVWTGTGQVTTGVTCENVTGRPGLVFWGYQIVNEKPLYNPGTSSNFDLDISEQADLVVSILKLAGISIEDEQLFQAARAEESLNIQQENK
tara:strand:- start:1396 stop:2106 length:711 start_codon:yes stop_codon:yes gene_type:complete